MTTGFAQVAGTWRNPHLELSFSPRMPHPTKPRLTMLDWVRSLPGRRWDPEVSQWIVTGIGPNPERVMAEAGFEVLPGVGPEFETVRSLADLYAPYTMLADNRRTVLMRHRLAGYDEALRLTGPAAVWDKKRQLFRVPVADVIIAGQVRGGVIWTQEIIDRAYEVHGISPAVPGLEENARILGSATDVAAVVDVVRETVAVIGHLPKWFGVKLFGYQIPGALAVAAGHTGLFDAPGVGKTVQFLAAAAAMGSERILVLCPPVVLTNWEREVIKSGVASADQIAVVRAGRKEPHIDGKKVVIIGDSMLASRPETAAKIVAWAPELVGYDEIHRAKTIGSKRSEAVLDLIAAVPRIKRVALTGTPLMAGPHELVPLLEFTGHMSSVFGGPSAFLARYCRQDKFGGWHARKEHLPELHQKLADHVWVRRTKEQVLPDLPKVSASAVALDIDLALYRKAHSEVIDQLVQWVADFETANSRLPSHTAVLPGATEYADEIAEYARESLRYVSQLRQAAGLTKIQTAAELIQDHIAATTEVDAHGLKTYTRPLVIWTHHKVVTEAMGAACADIGGGVITGGTSDTEKNRLVDAFQSGTVPVLVCSITAAGVGITLTRSSDVIFVENDWTPALISQAIDRCNRIGQVNHITVRFLIALGTLDEHIQAVLETKGGVVSEVMGDTAAQVGVMGDYEDLQTPQSIVEALVEEALRRYKKTGRPNGA